MVEIHESAVESAVKIKRDEQHGNVGFDFDSLFDDPQATDQVPDRPEWGKKEKLAFERDMLGLYVSDHPLAGLEIPLAKHASTTITELIGSEQTQDADTVTIAGLITSVQHRVAKKSGNQYGIIQVEDFGGEIAVMFMGKAYQEFAPALINDSVVVVRGRVSMRDDGMNLHAYSLFAPDLGQASDLGTLSITLAEARATTDTVQALGDVLIRHGGTSEVRLKLVKGSSARIFELPYQVTVSADLFGELKSLLGPYCLT
jgi:DNA polymerase-3 subunit alpha